MKPHPAIQLRDYIRDIPNFPKPGITFRDISPLLANGEAFSACISELAVNMPRDVEAIVGIESRGFLFGAALAQLTGVGFVPIRKSGKLPLETHAIEYELEYGTDILEIHKDALGHGHKVVVIDDLLATGGTAAATVQLCQKLGANVAACLFVIELEDLKGRDKLTGVPTFSLMKY
ncbi:MAG: adenine phosphoribosyltransferase [Zetaproteobacteria bacterium CG2_30_46_52]|nr:MAG: adenine phosphoribosyltransferase [Zetaproteobacteria bacterium CG2_30_46_52]